MELVVLTLVLAAIATWMSASRSRKRLDALEEVIDVQRRALEELRGRVQKLSTGPSAPGPSATAAAAPPPAPVSPVVAPPVAPPTPVAPPPAPTVIRPIAPPPVVRVPAEPPRTERPPERLPNPAAPPPPLRRAPVVEPAPKASFDWESLIGVRLFAAIAGIALVVAAVFFLRYSIEHGWLRPKSASLSACSRRSPCSSSATAKPRAHIRSRRTRSMRRPSRSCSRRFSRRTRSGT